MALDMDAARRQAKGALRNAGDFFWPPRSLVSGKRGVGAGPVAPSEFGELSFITAPLCDRCGVPQEIDLGPGSACAACIARPPAWQRARAALVYDEGSRRAVLDLKRSGRRDGLRTLAGWMVQAGRPLIDEADMIIPVPLHYWRLVRRTYNQAGWLAQAIAKRTGTPAQMGILKRVKPTPSQGGLSARARRRNVAGAFAVTKTGAQRAAGKRILLVDDVLTTGATLGACGRALKGAGAESVDALVLARVVRERDVTI